LSQYLGREFALHAGYRFYGDDWWMTGHTADLGIAKSFLGDSLLARVEGRFSWQDAASFYRDDYLGAVSGPIEVPAYRSADREMARMYNTTVAARAEYSVAARAGLRLGVNARVARVWYRYVDYSALPSRNAWVIGGGLMIDY
jgi:hypothetical protein